MRRDSYIGITDFANSAQVLELLELFKPYNSEYVFRKLMVGIMMSYKTLNKIPTERGWEHIWPDRKGIREIFLDHRWVMNCIHYADYKGLHILSSLEKVRRIGGKNLNAIQLDMTWPSNYEIIKFRHMFPEIMIVLQVGKQAFEAIGHSPKALAGRLRGYGDSIDYALLDESMGTGREMDSSALMPFFAEAADAMPALGLSSAGGIGPETTHLVDPLLAEFPYMSFDMQGQMRESGDISQPIEMPRAELAVKTLLYKMRNANKVNIWQS